MRRPTHSLLPIVAALGVLAPLVALPGPAAAAAPDRRIVHRAWSGDGLADGSLKGVELHNGKVRLSTPHGTEGSYEFGRWTSPWVKPGFTLTEMVPSWHAVTPGATWVRVEVRGRTSGRKGTWDTIARWSKGDKSFTRSSGDSQSDDLGRVLYDTWVTGGVKAWKLRVTLYRRTGGTKTPRLLAAGAMVSRLPSATGVATSNPGAVDGKALGKVLKVPKYSQMVHKGAYPQYDGGGEAWCSPTSTTMVLDYYDALPPPSAYAWVRKDEPDPVVAHLARMTYDAGFGGTGNWPFNTAFAATRAGNGIVTRLRSLREAERFIAAGIPLVASITFGSGELSGAPISASNGHLLVVVGFRKNGDVVVNDPAAGTRKGVRRTYDRGQFEDAWLKRYSSGGSLKGSGGLVYVINDDAHPLPARESNRNW